MSDFDAPAHVPPLPLAEWVAGKEAEDRGEIFASMVKEGRLDLPLPGGGATWERWEALAGIGAVDLSVARLSEGHTDAVAILSEAGTLPPTESRLGVWAAGPPETLSATAVSDGWRLKEPVGGARELRSLLMPSSLPTHRVGPSSFWSISGSEGCLRYMARGPPSAWRIPTRWTCGSRT